MDRANSILTDLEKKSTNEDYDLNGILRGSEVALTGNNIEQSGFTDSVYEEIIGDLRNIDLLRVTPIDALNILYKFQKKATEFKEATDE